MTFRSGQFVRFLEPKKEKPVLGLLVGHDAFASPRVAPSKLVTPNGAKLPLDALKLSGGELVEVLPHNHPDVYLLLTKFLRPEGFCYGHEPVVKTFLHEGCLVAYMGSSADVKVFPVHPDISSRVRNRIHAIHSFRRTVALPAGFRSTRANGFGKGDFVHHQLHGPAVHLGTSLIFERPFRMWPDSENDVRYVDWIDVSKSEASPGDLLPLQENRIDFCRSVEDFPETESSLSRNLFDLPPDWENSRLAHCACCGSRGLRFRNLVGLGIMRHCEECTWTGLIPSVRTTLRTILAAEQDFRVSLLAS